LIVDRQTLFIEFEGYIRNNTGSDGNVLKENPAGSDGKVMIDKYTHGCNEDFTKIKRRLYFWYS
jgi:hypothetical protein